MIQNHWLVIGRTENWRTALEQPIPVWGLKGIYHVEFRKLQASDFIWMYATKPAGGIIGVGTVKEKYIDEKNLIWPEEINRAHVIWPLRFRIQVLKVLPEYDWNSHCIRINDFNLLWQRGFQQVPEKMALEIFKRAQKVFSVSSFRDLAEGTSISQMPVVRDNEKISQPVVDSHTLIQNQIAEIGKLQFYHTQLEFPLNLSGERKSIDVVWKREISGAPTYVFEVELSGLIEKAIDRLLFAFNQWNSMPRIIIPEEIKVKIENKIKTAPKSFSEQIKVYFPDQISNLLEKKKQLREIEKELGLY